MSVKDKFTAEEWKSLLKTPMLVSYAVAGAAPSKEEGFTQEMAAVADGIIAGEQSASKDSLVGMIVADIYADADDDQRGQTESVSVGDIKGKALEHCRAINELLRAKADAGEAEEYKRWIIQTAHKVASAAKEGGFLGFGGSQVSGAEVSVINDIGEAIGV